MTNRKIMSQKAPNGDATGASEEQCMICKESSSFLLSCCGHPLCKSCFDSIKKHHHGRKEPTTCPNCQKLITALLPNGDATRAEKRAAIAARVTKAREEQAN